jgi:hypothetical protein
MPVTTLKINNSCIVIEKREDSLSDEIVELEWPTYNQ